MRNAIAHLVLATLLLSPVAPNWACFRIAGVQPTSKTTTLDLRERPEHSVVFRAGVFTLYVAPETLLAVMADDERSAYWPSAAGEALRARMPLTADVAWDELWGVPSPPSGTSETLASAATAETSDSAPGEVRSISVLDRQLQRIRMSSSWTPARGLADLIESDELAIATTDAPLKTIARENYTEPCEAGRRYRSPDGLLLIELIDMIS